MALTGNNKNKKSRRFTDQPAGNTTIIASGIQFKGDFKGEGHLFIAGHVACTAEVDGTVTIAESGSWEGTLTASNVIIAGEVTGDVSCSGNVELTPKAKIHGNITANTIAVAEGATIEGHLNTSSDKDVIRFKEKRDTTAQEETA